MGLFDMKPKGDDIKMDILKEKVMESLDKLNQEWVSALQKGETEGGVDLSDMFGKYSSIVSQVDKEFQAAKKRK